MITEALRRSDTALDNALGLACRNADRFYYEKGAERRAAKKAQAALTLEIAA